MIFLFIGIAIIVTIVFFLLMAGSRGDKEDDKEDNDSYSDTSVSQIVIDGIKYHLENGEAEISNQFAVASGDKVIPATVTCNGVSYTVTSVAANAFDWCIDLTSLDLSNTNITSIGYQAFRNCFNLTSVILPRTITSLGKKCFAYSPLISIDLSACTGLTSLPNFCFNNCSNLESITLPSTLTSLGYMCFSECIALTSIDLSATNIKSLGKACFEGCDYLASIKLPSGITSLRDRCFCGCISLTSVTLPCTIKLLGQECFGFCEKLSSVTCSWTSLEGVAAFYNAFDNIARRATLYVPVGATSIYRAKGPWSKFKNIIEII